MPRSTWLALLPLCSLSLAGCEGAQATEVPHAPEPLRLEAGSPRLGFVKLADVQPGVGNAAATATGKVAFNEDVTSRVASPVSGRVQTLHVRLGDRVKRGQPLVTIASPDTEAARADAVQADADLQVAQRALERTRRLFEEKAVPQKDVLAAEDDLAKAKSNVARTEARLQLLGVQRTAAFSATYVIRAPIDGTVVERTVLPGQEVRSDGATPLITVAQLDRLWVLADVFERDLAKVQVGAEAQVRVSAYPDIFSGVVQHVSEVVDPTSRSVKVRIAVDNAAGLLKPEMFAKVSLRHPAAVATLAIPASAVLTDGELSSVIVAGPGGGFHKRPVSVGPEQDGQVPVLDGLQAGERVVTEGALFVKAELESQQ